MTRVAEEEYDSIFNAEGESEGSEAEKEKHVEEFRKGFAKLHKNGPGGSYHQFLSLGLPFDVGTEVFAFPYDSFEALDAPSSLCIVSKVFPEIFKGQTPRECSLCVRHTSTSGPSLAGEPTDDLCDIENMRAAAAGCSCLMALYGWKWL